MIFDLDQMKPRSVTRKGVVRESAWVVLGLLPVRYLYSSGLYSRWRLAALLSCDTSVCAEQAVGIAVHASDSTSKICG